MNQRKRFTRAVIYIKDIARITGKKKTAARNLYYKIMKAFDKKPEQFLSKTEFARYTGIEMDYIESFM